MGIETHFSRYLDIVYCKVFNPRRDPADCVRICSSPRGDEERILERTKFSPSKWRAGKWLTTDVVWD